MRLEIARLAVVGNTGKHGAVIHMVAIEAGIVHGEICIAVGIHKDAAVGVGRTVKGMGQVKVVINTLHDRIVDLGIRAVDPADHLVIPGLQGGKVNLDRTGSDLGRRRGHLRCFRSRGRGL